MEPTAVHTTVRASLRERAAGWAAVVAVAVLVAVGLWQTQGARPGIRAR